MASRFVPRAWDAGAVKRATATVAAAALFVFAVVLALSFADPAQSPPSSEGTVRLFLALGALFPAGLAVYLAGRGDYRQAMRAAIVVAVLYGAFFAVSFVGAGESPFESGAGLLIPSAIGGFRRR